MYMYNGMHACMYTYAREQISCGYAASLQAIIKRTDQRAKFERDKKDDLEKMRKGRGGRGRAQARGRAAGRGRGRGGRGRGAGRGACKKPAAKIAAHSEGEGSRPDTVAYEGFEVEEHPDGRQETADEHPDVCQEPADIPSSQPSISGKAKVKAGKAKAKAKARVKAKAKARGKAKAKAKAQGKAKAKACAAQSDKDEGFPDEGAAKPKIRKTFAGRRPPSTEQALARYEVLQATFNRKLAHRFTTPSLWEACTRSIQ